MHISKKIRIIVWLLGGGIGGAGGILDTVLEVLVGAPGGADDIDDVELLVDPKIPKKKRT